MVIISSVISWVQCAILTNYQTWGDCGKPHICSQLGRRAGGWGMPGIGAWCLKSERPCEGFALNLRGLHLPWVVSVRIEWNLRTPTWCQRVGSRTYFPTRSSVIPHCQLEVSYGENIYAMETADQGLSFLCLWELVVKPSQHSTVSGSVASIIRCLLWNAGKSLGGHCLYWDFPVHMHSREAKPTLWLRGSPSFLNPPVHSRLHVRRA